MQLIPAHEMAELLALPAEVRTEVQIWSQRLAGVARPGIGEQLARIAGELGVSVQSARRKYDAYLVKGWRGLINRAKLPQDRQRKPAAFVEWWQSLVSMQQRSGRAAYREFTRRFACGEPIPGIDPDVPRHYVPRGFSYDTLNNLCPSKFEVAALRRGLSYAVGSYGPQIFRTRAALWYGSHYMIDDLWHDNFVVFGRQIVRVLELDCLEVFSGALVMHGCQPRVKREDGHFDNLKEHQARLLAASVLWNEGYSPRGTEFIAEHGTAALDEHTKAVMHNATGGLVKVRESGIVGQEQAVIGWSGEGKGNFRFKAALESIRNLKHNELADMVAIPAQTGKDVDHRPEHTHGQLKECESWLKIVAAIARTDPERARQIRLNLLDYHAHFMPLLMRVYDAINRREWHDLEGWEEAGHVAVQYRTTPTSDHLLSDKEFNELPAVSRELLRQTALEDPRYIVRRRLSPHEVRARHRGGMIRPPSAIIAEMLGPDLGRELEVEGAYFRPFSAQALSPSPLLYESVVETMDGRREQLRDAKYAVLVNPFDLQTAFVQDARGITLGTARRATRIDPTDEHALHVEYANRQKRLAEMKGPLLKRHAEITREEIKRLDHNLGVMAGPTPTAEERAEGAAAADDLLAALASRSDGADLSD